MGRDLRAGWRQHIAKCGKKDTPPALLATSAAMDEPREILVCGWRSIPHSYAVVSEYQCLELLRRAPRMRLFFQDMPYFNPSWQASEGMHCAESEAALRSIPPPPAGLRADAELRIEYPYDLLRPARAARTTVFGTAEYLSVPPSFFAGRVNAAEAQKRSGFGILTPSNWSKQGFVRSGMAAENVTVLTLGFDPAVFRPVTQERRAQIRAEMGFSPDDFIFYHAGSMSLNKGLRFLLPAFARLAQSHPHAQLLLKGLDSLYSSRQVFEAQLGGLAPEVAQTVASRLRYVGERLSYADMARLYQASDCYVSPYVGEGFNMPVLEAAACGLPVICTAGGPTDDFVTEDFALQIASTLEPVAVSSVPRAMGLIPDQEHLAHLMLCAIDDAEFRESARAAGPTYVGERFTWAKVVDRLLPIILPGSTS
jgi:glycosyltransferase involved in cell wall biosynthesis